MSTGSAPAPRRPSAPESTTLTSESRSFATRFVDLWWITIPGKLRRYSVLLWAAWSDGIYLTAWPRVATCLVFALFLFGFAEGITHWSYRTIVGSNGFAGNVLAPMATANNWGGPTHYLFADNLLLLMIAVLVGSLSANLGITLVIGYAAGDLLHGVDLPYESWHIVNPFNALVARHLPLLITYTLFFLLASLPILMAMELARSSHPRINKSAPLRVGVTAIIQAALIYCWGCMAPMVFRIVAVWVGGVSRITVPFYAQITATWLVPTAVVAIAVRAFLFRTSRHNARTGAGIRALVAQTRQNQSSSVWQQTIICSGLIMVLVSGFLQTPDFWSPPALWNFAQNGIVFATLAYVALAEEFALPHSRIWTRWSATADQYPAILRLSAATIATYLFCWILVEIPGLQSVRSGEFGPEIASILIGVGFVIVLLPEGWGGAPVANRVFPRLWLPIRSRAAHASIICAIVFLATKKLFGDCNDYSCCFAGHPHAAAAAAAGSIPALGGIRRRRRRQDPCEVLRRAYQQAKGTLDALDAQIKQVADQYNEDLGKLRNLNTQMANDMPAAMAVWDKLKWYMRAEYVASALADIASIGFNSMLAEFGVIPELGDFPTGFALDTIQKIQQIYSMWQSQVGGLNIDAYRDIANEWNGIVDVAPFMAFLNLLDQINEVVDKMEVLLDKYDALAVDRQGLVDKVAKAKAALQRCLRQHRPSTTPSVHTQPSDGSSSEPGSSSTGTSTPWNPDNCTTEPGGFGIHL